MSEAQVKPLIDPKMAAEALRRLADRFDSGKCEVKILDHTIYRRIGHNHTDRNDLTIKWEE